MNAVVFCCRRARPEMGAGLSGPESGGATTMAEVMRERRKKGGGGGGLGTLRRRLAGGRSAAAESARWARAAARWQPAQLAALHDDWEAASVLRDYQTQAEQARCPAPTLEQDLGALRRQGGGDVELAVRGAAVPAHRALLAARCPHLREQLARAGPARCLQLDRARPLSAADLDALLAGIYEGEAALTALTAAPTEPVCGGDQDCCQRTSDLDILVPDTKSRRFEAARIRRLAEEFGFRLDTLHRDMRYLLDSGEMADAALVFTCEGAGGGGAGGGGGGSEYGFRASASVELACHRAVLAARSRYFRALLTRARCAAAAASQPVARVALDELVVPRRFARALLHAAYTDQLDLALMSGGGGSGGAQSHASAAGGKQSRSKQHAHAVHATLADLYALYEIARFVEMPMVVRRCEDAIVGALAPDTVGGISAWAAQQYGSAWVARQAARYVRDNFYALANSGAASSLPRAAMHAALASPYLQAPEWVVLRALVRWGERAAAAAVAGEGGAGAAGAAAGGRGARGRAPPPSDAAVRDAIAPLVSLVRAEHLPPDSDVVRDCVRRHLLPQHMAPPPEPLLADAWLAVPPYRPPRLYLPYLDELKVLLEAQPVSEAELMRVRRQRYVQQIPDTLYMVGEGECGGGEGEGGEWACVGGGVARALRRRALELHAHAAPPLPAHRRAYHKQIWLRAVREFGLPDSCADAVMREGGDLCAAGAGVNSAAGAGAGAGRASWEGGLGGAGGGGGGGRLSQRVPDVAMCRSRRPPPNANTHLLSSRDYCRAAPPAQTAAAHTLPYHHLPYEFVGGAADLMQLDLGDGASHTPTQVAGSRVTRTVRRVRDDVALDMTMQRGMWVEGAATLPRHGEGRALARRGASLSPAPRPARSLSPRPYLA